SSRTSSSAWAGSSSTMRTRSRLDGRRPGPSGLRGPGTPDGAGGCWLGIASGRKAVEQHPVEAQRTDGVGELLKIDGLDDVAVDPQVIAGLEIVILVRRGQHDHGDLLGPRIRLDPAEHFDSIDLGELQVEEDHPWDPAGFRAVGEEKFHRLRPVPGHLDMIGDAVLPQRADGHLRVARVVFHQQDVYGIRTHAAPSFGSVKVHLGCAGSGSGCYVFKY